MKKNKSMRLAGGLMIATMLSTSIVSGTYAKYVTSDSASDSARVAKFGVVVQADGTLFGKNYLAAADNTPTDATEGITVKSLSNPQDNVVAPGTKNDTGMSFAITGTPEVDVKVDITIDESTLSDVFLAAGEYPNMTTGDTTDKFEVTDDYYPIVYTLTDKNGEVVESGNLATVSSALSEYTMNDGTNIIYSAGTNLADEIGTLKLTWEWAYGTEEGISDNDKADTLLGDLAAEIVDDVSEDAYNLNTEIDLTITVTQVD